MTDGWPAWRPAIHQPDGDGPRPRLPVPGQVIAYIGSRTAWRVLDVHDRAHADWQEQTRRAWQLADRPDPATWRGRERMVLAEPARNPASDLKDRRGLPLYPWVHRDQWWPLPDPYPVCVDCGLLWPCPCQDTNLDTAAAAAELDRLTRILPGCCWACGEPVTARQHHIEFPGDNLLLPGAGPVLFHTTHTRRLAARGPSGNQTCRSEAERYESRWVAAGPGRRARLCCAGVLRQHADGIVECTVDLCPGPAASHHVRESCTAQLVPPGDGFGWSVVHYPNRRARAGELLPTVPCSRPNCRARLRPPEPPGR